MEKPKSKKRRVVIIPVARRLMTVEIRPTRNAKNVVRITASISEIGKNIYKIIKDDSIPTIIDNPPGRGIIGFSFLFMSVTVIFRFSNALITIGVSP